MEQLIAKQLAHLQTLLLQDQKDMELKMKEHEESEQNHSLGDQTAELSAYDNHPADLGTELFEREKDLALHIHAEQQLNDINDALLAMEKGSYGTCSVCHHPIPYERLLAIPSTLTCIDHTQSVSLTEKRPIEEQLLQPPFGRSSLDERDFNGFDGEDAWQIVESWGTSNSPAMAEDNEITDYNDMEIEPDELDGFVESLESFLATDIYGQHVTFIRNKAYHQYMDDHEGDTGLEADYDTDTDTYSNP